MAPGLREEVGRRNFLMIGPTGFGKTEIARRLARLAHAPFLKVEATKFTEVGYVGRDVESIVRDLVEVAITMGREAARKGVEAKAELAAEETLLTALVGEGASGETRLKFRRMLREGQLEGREIEVPLADAGTATHIGLMDFRGGRPPGWGGGRSSGREAAWRKWACVATPAPLWCGSILATSVRPRWKPCWAIPAKRGRNWAGRPPPPWRNWSLRWWRPMRRKRRKRLTSNARALPGWGHGNKCTFMPFIHNCRSRRT